MGADELSLRSTRELLREATSGSASAAAVLVARIGPRLERWARGRVLDPEFDSDALVQETLVETLRESPDPEHGAPLYGELRRAIDERLPVKEASSRSQVEELYESAFRRLSFDEQTALAGRLEEGLSYEEIARELGVHDEDSARDVVGQAVLRLAEEMARSTGAGVRRRDS